MRRAAHGLELGACGTRAFIGTRVNHRRRRIDQIEYPAERRRLRCPGHRNVPDRYPEWLVRRGRSARHATHEALGEGLHLARKARGDQEARGILWKV